MKRNLLTQIKNEWRDNLWLVIELAIVAVAIWALSFTLYDTLRPKFDDKGYDIDNVSEKTVRNMWIWVIGRKPPTSMTEKP